VTPTGVAVHAPAGRAATTDARLRVLFVGGLGRSGSTLLDRMLGQLDGVCSVGELVHLWERGLKDNNLCGCRERFRDCPFWRQVGEAAFGGWHAVDVDEVLALKRAVDRNRNLARMCLPALWPRYRARLDRYLGLLDRLYRAVGQVAGQPLLVDTSKHASHAFLLRRLPGLDLRVVHLVRDSRAVAFAWTKLVRRLEVADGRTLMATTHPLTTSRRWLAYNLLFHLLRRLGVATLLLRYETLVADPAAELGRVLAHTGRATGLDELRFLGDGWVELGASHALAGNPMRFRRGRTPLRLDDAWRGRLRRLHRLLTAATTWPLLLRYGYLRGHDRTG
jgi:Sulfotransferase family